MKMICGVQVIESINDFLHDSTLANRFYTWQGKKSSDFINEPDRAEHGSTHAEHIDDFQEFGDDLLRDAERDVESAMEDLADSWDDDSERKLSMLLNEVELCRKAFDADVKALTQWHIENGSYEQQIG